MDSFSYTNVLSRATSPGLVLAMNFVSYNTNSSSGLCRVSQLILSSTTSSPVFLPDFIFSFVQNRDFYLLFFQLFLLVLCTAYHDRHAVFAVMTGSTRHFSFYFCLFNKLSYTVSD